MYYLCSKNKGADQLRGYREADLRLCFRICKKPVFSRGGSYNRMSSFNPSQGVQGRMVLVVNFFVFLKLLFFCFVVAIVDLVHNVEAIFPLS